MLFSSKRPSDNILSHVYAPLDNFQFSTNEFYDEIEKELAARQTPGLKISRVDFREGGLLSEKRVYLRLARERYAFDICAAPFGRGYFFSLRIVEKPRGGWLALLLYLLVFYFLCTILMYAVSQYLTITVVLLVAALAYWFFRPQPVSSTATSGGGAKVLARTAEYPDFTGFLLDLPVIGAWYERVRKDTYYRLDTRMVYLALISEIYNKKLDEVTAAKGVKLLRNYEYQPILKGLYQSEERVPGNQPEPQTARSP